MKRIHHRFKLNGISLDGEGLKELAYSWVKEGEDFEVHAGDFLLDWLSPSDTVDVKTSGSTGMPKIISIKKAAMVHSALATGQCFDLSPNDSALLCLPSQYIAGKMMLVRAMVLGLQLDVISPSSHPIKEIQGKYDFVAMVPLQVQNSLDDIKKITTLIIGGAPISKSLRKNLAEQSNTIYETYGMTETITHIAVKNISSAKHDSKNAFKVLPDIRISKDERNCLIINAPKIFNGPIITNDLVDIIDENHFKWLGRYDNIINSGGVKLIPEQIEEKLSVLLNTRFFVTGIPDEKLGKRLVLFIEGHGQQKDLLKKRIQKLSTLKRFEIPKQILYVKNFVETPTGKVLRQQVKYQYLNN